jgi:hypothetical protein
MRQTPDGAGTRTGQAVRPLRRQHGARVALALTRALRESGGPAPYELLVASSSGPALHVPVRGWSEPDEQLVTYLRDLGGTPRQLFDDPDLLALFLPTLRADLTVIGTCPANDEPPLATPVRAFAGAQEHGSFGEDARLAPRDHHGVRPRRGGLRLLLHARGDAASARVDRERPLARADSPVGSP